MTMFEKSITLCTKQICRDALEGNFERALENIEALKVAIINKESEA